MPTLRTGLVVAAGYADKVRRVLFAQLRDAVKSGQLTNQDVAMAAGSLNRFLFELLVNELKVDKLDVVRVQIDYEVKESKVVFDFSSLRVEVWRRLPDEEVERVVRSFASRAEEVIEEALRLDVEKLGETDVGDVVYRVLYRGAEVGAILVTPLNGKAVVRGAVVEPTPLVVRRTTVEFEGSVDEYLRRSVSDIFRGAQNVERREAVRVVNEVLALVRAAEVGEGLEGEAEEA